jgi:predicted outer membrane lipoprotein
MRLYCVLGILLLIAFGVVFAFAQDLPSFSERIENRRLVRCRFTSRIRIPSVLLDEPMPRAFRAVHRH